MRKLKIIDLGLTEYDYAQDKMRQIHSRAIKEGLSDYLILCQHYDVYTVGKNENRKFCVDVKKTDRGGSIMFHAPGQQIFYFVFKVKTPMLFYKNVIKSFEKPLKNLSDKIEYIHSIPGFYIQNRKLGFLGFKYQNGYSLHGVAINYNIDLDKFNLINPCGLEGYKATSIVNEHINVDLETLNQDIIKSIIKNFKLEY